MMKAVSFSKQLPIKDDESFIDVRVEKPTPGPRDILVEVHAISVNPVDTKIRRGGGPGQPSGALKILGWDASGVVVAVGSEVSLFAPGDEVFYAGSLDRPGSYAEFQIVDERLVGRKPTTIPHPDAAALPLTTITAWEMLFGRLAIRPGKPTDQGSILIIGGAGGVGSIATQLARRLTGLNIIATASRPESEKWCREMGAHHVIDHREPLAAQVNKITPSGVQYVLALTRVEDHFEEIIAAMAPYGGMVLIENPAKLLDLAKMKPKSLSLHWEYMFGPAHFQSASMAEQGRILTEVAALVDAGVIRSTICTNFGVINAENMKLAHAAVESGKTLGKVVLWGF